MIRRSVLLPDPFGPMRPSDSPRLEVHVHVAQGPDLLPALAVPRMEQGQHANLQVEGRVVPEDEALRDPGQLEDAQVRRAPRSSGSSS